MIYFCCNDDRRILVRGLPEAALNGIDYLEVVDNELKDSAAGLRQRLLRIFFLRDPSGGLLGRLQDKPPSLGIKIAGGERIKEIRAVDANFDAVKKYLEVTVSSRGDYSTYTLSLVEADGKPLQELDPELACVDFSFKVECPSDFDCLGESACPPGVRSEPELDYLARDYGSLRQLILDRLALIAPAWHERNPADLGVTLVELLAYVGDHLSYRQDVIATEAYLGTARQRPSLRRHARLLDYRMHDGCNARAWVQLRLNDTAPPGGVILPLNSVLAQSVGAEVTRTCFSTDAGVTCLLASDEAGLQQILDARAPVVFEPMHHAFLHSSQQDMKFYTFGEERCCLPKGALKAALAGHLPYLSPGQVLVLQEVRGPLTGQVADADPAKSHAVRLTVVNGKTAVDYDRDRKGGTALAAIIPCRSDPVSGEAYTKIEWSAEDALPFALCVSSFDKKGKAIPPLSLAQGNIVLADQGRTLSNLEEIAPVPSPKPVLAPVVAGGNGCCDGGSPRVTPARFRPRLRHAPLTQAQALPNDFQSTPAVRVTAQDPRGALPAIVLSDPRGELWRPQHDLIGSDPFAPEFVVEIENDGQGALRFGDDVNGMQPAEGTVFTPRYRIGNGVAGNVGAGSLTQVYAPEFLDPDFFPDQLVVLPKVTGEIIASVTNLLPGWGGVEPETLEEVRQYAPQAFKVPRRCVTAEDYASRANEHPRVQRAAATSRWTGSWHTFFLSVDPRGGGDLTDALRTDLSAWLEPYRLAGHDLEINGPSYLSLELTLTVVVADGYFRSDVRAALSEAFSASQRPDGARGFFHPDNFSFGDPVYVSAIYAAAQGVAGVKYVELGALRRQGAQSGPVVPDAGVFLPDRSEIVRLDNDPNFPDHGTLNFVMRGGR
jgi:hypothetical protein